MLRALAEVVFPAICPGCGGRGEPLCASCAGTIRPAPALAPPAGLDALAVPFAYAGVTRELVARAKYRHRHAALGWLADATAHALDAVALPADVVVTWAPTTAARRRARGFDQAEVLAAAVAAVRDHPVRGVLRRIGHDHQTGRTRAERIDAPTFRVVRPAAVTGRSVLVVDDVVTTGATLTAAAATLRAAGATGVIGAVAARRP
jgi:predicted amidophosphoribosyltransferase